jgi:TonB family protein
MTLKNLALAAIVCASVLAISPAFSKKAQIVQVEEAEAQAVVRILIDSRGNSIEIEMVRSSKDRDIDRSIFQAARRFKIEPQPGAKKPAAGWYVIPAKLAQD